MFGDNAFFHGKGTHLRSTRADTSRPRRPNTESRAAHREASIGVPGHARFFAHPQRKQATALLLRRGIGVDRKGVRRVEYRRRVPRQYAGWTGKYSIEGDGPEDWHECRILDISLIGIGLELFGPRFDHDDLSGQRIVVETHTPAGASLSIRARGEVRNVAHGANGGTRVGLELVDLSDLERSILEALTVMDAFW